MRQVSPTIESTMIYESRGKSPAAYKKTDLSHCCGLAAHILPLPLPQKYFSAACICFSVWCVSVCAYSNLNKKKPQHDNLSQFCMTNS